MSKEIQNLSSNLQEVESKYNSLNEEYTHLKKLKNYFEESLVAFIEQTLEKRINATEFQNAINSAKNNRKHIN